MAQQKTTPKTEVSASVLTSALKTMQTLKIDKVYVASDAYIFPKECDARAYVGKDGKYTTLTKADCMPQKAEAPVNKPKAETKGDAPKSKEESGENEKKATSTDPLMDEHKKEE